MMKEMLVKENFKKLIIFKLVDIGIILDSIIYHKLKSKLFMHFTQTTLSSSKAVYLNQS